jgi:hypothetical protein
MFLSRLRKAGLPDAGLSASQNLDVRRAILARAGDALLGELAMKLLSLGRRAFAALLLAPVSLAFAFQTAPNQPADIGSTNAASTAPSVPAPAVAPCVVNLVQDLYIYESPTSSPSMGAGYTYAPPAGCPGPWSKVILKVSVVEDFEYGDSTEAYIRLGGVQIYEGSMSNLPYQRVYAPAGASWEVERDVTDMSSLFVSAQNGVINLFPDQNYWFNFQDVDQVISAQLLFYPASSAQPAQHTPDAVYGVFPDANVITLPHNIVRAYLDVYSAEPYWFTCIPDQEDGTGRPFFSAIAIGGGDKIGNGTPSEGCDGGSFAEIEVSIDGSPAGVAPVFPLLSSAYNFEFFNPVNAPIQPPQLLNHIPYRVDLSPFAAVLNVPGPHTIALSRGDAATLLVYEDKGSNQVSGAVTLNTLAGSPGAPAVTDTIQNSGDSASGEVTTGLDRNFTIQGFVITSKGRVDSSVQQTSHFQNTQDFYLDGLTFPNYREYRQHIQLASQTQQHSRRVRAGTVLSDDVTTASYPLDLLYDMTGYVLYADIYEAYPLQGTVSATQHRNLDAAHLKHGVAPYASAVRENFVSSRTYNTQTAQSSNWQAQADYKFHDTLLSCHQESLTALNGAVTAESDGTGCPNGQNSARWFAHPDGSPDGLGWAH